MQPALFISKLGVEGCLVFIVFSYTYQGCIYADLRSNFEDTTTPFIDSNTKLILLGIG